MDMQAGASRYAVSVLLYLTAVTIYAVNKDPVEMPVNANGQTDSGARAVEAGPVRCVGPFAPGLPCTHGHWADRTFFGLCQSL